MPRVKKQQPRTIKVGIDLGNGYSTLAVMRAADRVEYLKGNYGNPAHPSALYLAENGEHYWGQSADNAERINETRCIRYFKRAMPDTDENGQAPPIYIDGSKLYTAEDVAAEYLRQMKVAAELAFGVEIHDVTITTPSNYPNSAKVRTKNAGLRAGFQRVRLLDEPTAAALAYGLDKDFEGVLLISDLGAGTYDVTVLRIEGGKFQALATGGEECLGGIDHDNLIIGLIQRQYKSMTGQDIDIRANSGLLVASREEVQRAKHTLSELPETQVTVIVNETKVSFKLTREQYEEMLKPQMERMEAIVRETVDKAGVGGMSGVDRVALVGGASRTPAVGAMLRRVTGQEPRSDIDPATAVAHGAAIYAQVVDFSEDATTVIDRKPTDDPVRYELMGKIDEIVPIAPNDLGVRAKLVGNHALAGQLVLAPIYKTGTPLGKRFEERFTPEHPWQQSVQIAVLQGKALTLASENDELGVFHIPIASGPSRHENSLSIGFEFTIDGIVRVWAKDLVGGAEGMKELTVK